MERPPKTRGEKCLWGCAAVYWTALVGLLVFGGAKAVIGWFHKTPASPTLVAPSASAVTVYVTRSGKKYHRESCRYAKNADPISLDDARSGYEPCKVCHPPR